jgi:xanthine dehydrogenase accessory factor
VLLAGQLDYRATAVDQPSMSGALAVVVASHGRDEIEVLAAALDADVPYIGLVASRRRSTGVLAELARARPDLARIAAGRVHSPAGLDIGARTSAEIALSILAEVVSARLHSAAPPERAAGAPASGTTTITSGAAGPAAIIATDPVCGMTVASVESSLQLDHDGHRVYFCGPGCLRAFSANPGGFDSSPTAERGERSGNPSAPGPASDRFAGYSQL